MVGDREARQPGGEFESTAGSVQAKDHVRVLQINISPTSGVLENHRVGVHQVLNIGTGRRPTHAAKAACVKTFVEKYDTVTAPSGEGQAVKKEMTVQVEQWWNTSDVTASLREENALVADVTVDVV